MKDTEETFYTLEHWSQEVPLVLPCSQNSNVSDNWLIDSNSLSALCDEEQDLAWKFDVSSQSKLVDCLPLSQESGKLTGLCKLDDSLLTQNLINITTAALSPPRSPGSEEIDISDDDLELILSSPVPEAKKVEEIENWLRMSCSSQGNEFLSQEKPVEDVMMESIATEVLEGEVIVLATDVMLKVEAVETAVSVEKQKRRKVHSIDTSQKKRTQNKEAARRYRDKKKSEAEEFAATKSALDAENTRLKNQLKKKKNERKVLLDLWKKCVDDKTNPHFTVTFPSWFS